MKYLHDNGFKVIRMSDLGFSDANNDFYVKTDHNDVSIKSPQNENFDQEYNKWHYFSIPRPTPQIIPSTRRQSSAKLDIPVLV